MKALGFLESKYDMIFLDPPYADTSLGSVITGISQSSLINGDSIILVSHAARSALSDRYDSLLKIKEKRYGDTGISIYQKEVAA